MTAESIFTIAKGARGDAMIAKIAGFLSRLSTDRAWRISVQELRASRSSQQNRYLYGVCYSAISDAIGYEVEEVAEFLCGTYWGWTDKRVPKTPRNPEGLASVPVRTTTRNENGQRDVLNKQQFSDYVAFVQRFAASKGIYIEDPEGGL